MFQTIAQRLRRATGTRRGQVMASIAAVCLLGGAWSIGGRGGPGAAQEAALASVLPHIEQVERDSASAVDRQVARVDAYFAGLATKVPAFSRAVLGDEGKLQAGGAILEGGVNALAEMFGEKPVYGRDSFLIYVEQSFKRLVLDPERFRSEIDSATSGWNGEVQAIEAKLLVDLNADLDDASLDLGTLTPSSIDLSAADQVNAVVTEAIDVAAKDMLVVIGKFTASLAIGDAVADRITDEDASWLKKMGINAAVGYGVDKALDQAVSQAGYNPEAQLTAKISFLLSRMRSLIVDGDPNANKRYADLLAVGEGHPDESARAACREAAAVLRKHANLGLRRRLLDRHEERCRARQAALSVMILGVERLSRNEAASNHPLANADASTVLSYARECSGPYGKPGS